ncbi:MAG: excisionase family DNA-binding protein [Thermoleophilaceae bacterium]|nr:excisionase family DNA-binding protein [Thermoleophilaceae bacterium]
MRRIARFGDVIASQRAVPGGAETEGLTLTEAASRLGISTTTLRRRLRQRRLEPMRDGRRLLVREHQLWQLRSEGSTSLDREQNVGDSARQMSEHVPPRAQTVGPWVATLRGDVVFSADTAREVVAWLEAQDLIADSLYRLPVDPSAAEGAAPA